MGVVGAVVCRVGPTSQRRGNRGMEDSRGKALSTGGGCCAEPERYVCRLVTSITAVRIGEERSGGVKRGGGWRGGGLWPDQRSFDGWRRGTGTG